MLTSLYCKLSALIDLQLYHKGHKIIVIRTGSLNGIDREFECLIFNKANDPNTDSKAYFRVY